MNDFPVLVRDGVEKTPETLSEFIQLNYDGWAKQDPDAVVPTPSEEEQAEATVASDANPPTPPADQNDGPPPQSGKGSGESEWRAYAEKHGVVVEPDAKRDDIVEALKTAGRPTEQPQ